MAKPIGLSILHALRVIRCHPGICKRDVVEQCGRRAVDLCIAYGLVYRAKRDGRYYLTIGSTARYAGVTVEGHLVMDNFRMTR